MKKIIFALISCCVVLNVHADEIPADTTVNVESAWVQEFLQKANSVFANKASNYAESFFTEARDARADWPTVVNVSLTAPENAEKVVVNVYLDAESTQLWQTDSVTRDSVGNFNFVLRNMIPGQTYYLVSPTENVTVFPKSVKAEGQLRMIALDEGFNIRDLGGWLGFEGKRLKYGQIYRGGSLGGMNKDAEKSIIGDKDRRELKRLGVFGHLDLRSKLNQGMVYGNEGSLHSYSLGYTPLLEGDIDNTMTDYGAYDEDASVVANMAWIIYELKNGRPVYFNCRQGADRTGTMAYFIEALCGCAEHSNSAGGNQLALDYELTGFSRADLIDNIKDKSIYRPAQEGYTNQRKIFRKLIDLTSDDVKLNTLQEKCYYYLNQYKEIKIDAADLDWFICFMLGLSEEEYAPHRPSWAKSGSDLQTVGESMSNVVKYYDGRTLALKVTNKTIDSKKIKLTYNKTLTLLQPSVELAEGVTANATVSNKILTLTFTEEIGAGRHKFTVPVGVVSDGDTHRNDFAYLRLTVFPPAVALGDTITKLSKITTDKTYMIYNPTYSMKMIYAPDYSEMNVWAGETKAAEGRTPADSYTEKVNNADSYASWMLVKYKSKYYLYNMGAQKFLKVGTDTGTREATFVSAATNVVPKQLTDGLAFYSTSGTNNYLCAAPQLSYPLSVWTYGDKGSLWQFIENPNVEADLNTVLLTIDPTYDGIETVNKNTTSHDIFTIDGRRIEAVETRHGIYIQDGRKILK